MQGKHKQASDCDAFCSEYIIKRKNAIQSPEEYAFLLGYYAHLITDAAFQAMIRDKNRVSAAWNRIKADEKWRAGSEGMAETWDSVKELIPNETRMREIHAIEADYLTRQPDSGYLTEILPLRTFPDYIDYLPHGAIARKVKVMAYLPKADKAINYLCISQKEYAAYIEDTIQQVIHQFTSKCLL